MPEGGLLLDECGICGGVNDTCSDCAGVPNGAGTIDQCNTCAPSPAHSCVRDCLGVWGGKAMNDECGVCQGTNSTCSDCAGVPYGPSVVDRCITCVSPTTKCISDCKGIWGGGAQLDLCDVCAGDSTSCVDCAGVAYGDFLVDKCDKCVSASGQCVADCDGTWGGSKLLDGCGICGGDGASCLDCAGTINGDFVVDKCGHCVAPAGSCVADCDGVWGAGKVMDACNVCGGDGVCRDAVRVDITLPGLTICDMAASIKSAISTSTGLAEKYIEIQTCIVDGSQTTLTFQLLVATTSRRRRMQYGSLMLNLGAGLASAAGIDESALATGTPQTLPLDCAGVAGGNATLDQCSICSGDNSTCSDCAGVPNGAATSDQCLSCDSDDGNNCAKDCSGVWGGSSTIDNCDICGGDHSTCSDCSGIPHGNATIDQCDTCDADPTNDCVKDCRGVWGGTGTDDLCGICGGTNTCSDCAGVAHGNATEDDCGTCDADAANDCVRDCLGVWAGSAEVDACGVCSGTNSTCKDCNGVPRGSSEMDHCGTCDMNSANDCFRDCSGIWGGANLVDKCGVCDNVTANDGETCKVVLDPDLTSPNAALPLQVQLHSDSTAADIAAAMAGIIGIDEAAIEIRGDTPTNKTAEVTLAGSYASVAGDEQSRLTFQKQVQDDISTLLGINSTRVIVDQLVAGSVAVTFTVLPDSSGVPISTSEIDSAMDSSLMVFIDGLDVANYTVATAEVELTFVIDTTYILLAGEEVSTALESLEEQVSQGAITGLPAQSIFASVLFECPSGFYTDDSGACVRCAAGSEPNEAQDDCTPCTDRVTTQQSSWYSPIGATCELCPAGKQPNDARTVCMKCEKGTFSDGMGSGCVACPSNQRQNADADGCVCQDDFYNATQGAIVCYGLGVSYEEDHFITGATDANSHCQPCDTKSGCLECADGMATLMPGFVLGPDKETVEVNDINKRMGAVAIFKCPLEAGCMGQTNASVNESVSKCAVGYSGPLCAVCADQYVKSGLECVNCSDLSSSSQFLVITVSVCLLVAFCTLFKCFRTKDVEVGQQFNPNGEMARAMAQGKIVVGLFQMLSEMPSTLQLTYPAAFTAALRALRMFMLDIFDIFKIDCVGSVSIYLKFIATMIAPCIFVFVVQTLRKMSNDRALGSTSFKGASPLMLETKHAENRAKADYRVLFGIFLMYPMLSRTCFHMFLCHTIGPGQSFHPDDYSVACEGSAVHALFLLFAVITTIIYPVGIPVSFLALLYRDKLKATKQYTAKTADTAKGVRSTSRISRMRRGSVEMLTASSTGPSSMEFLRRDFKADCYYYECIALFEKLLLIGLLIFISQGSSFQAFVGGIIAFVFFAIQARMWPYVHREDNVLKALSQATMFVTLFVSVILRTDLDERNDAVSRDDYGTLLIFAIASTPLVWIFIMLRRLKQYCSRRREKDASTKNSLHKLAGRGAKYGLDKPAGGQSKVGNASSESGLEEASSSDDDAGPATKPPPIDTTSLAAALPQSNFVFNASPSPGSAEFNMMLEESDKYESKPLSTAPLPEVKYNDSDVGNSKQSAQPPPPPPSGDEPPALPPRLPQGERGRSPRVASVSFRSPSIKTRVLARHHAPREELSTSKRMTASTNGVVHI
eukprot:COSAG05_NODE_900_length_6670_cov_2.425963_2_plen_1627_part_00